MSGFKAAQGYYGQGRKKIIDDAVNGIVNPPVVSEAPVVVNAPPVREGGASGEQISNVMDSLADYSPEMIAANRARREKARRDYELAQQKELLQNNPGFMTKLLGMFR